MNTKLYRIAKQFKRSGQVLIGKGRVDLDFGSRYVEADNANPDHKWRFFLIADDSELISALQSSMGYTGEE